MVRRSINLCVPQLAGTRGCGRAESGVTAEPHTPRPTPSTARRRPQTVSNGALRRGNPYAAAQSLQCTPRQPHEPAYSDNVMPFWQTQTVPHAPAAFANVYTRRSRLFAHVRDTSLPRVHSARTFRPATSESRRSTTNRRSRAGSSRTSSAATPTEKRKTKRQAEHKMPELEPEPERHSGRGSRAAAPMTNEAADQAFQDWLKSKSRFCSG